MDYVHKSIEIIIMDQISTLLLYIKPILSLSKLLKYVNLNHSFNLKQYAEEDEVLYIIKHNISNYVHTMDQAIKMARVIYLLIVCCLDIEMRYDYWMLYINYCMKVWVGRPYGARHKGENRHILLGSGFAPAPLFSSFSHLREEVNWSRFAALSREKMHHACGTHTRIYSYIHAHMDEEE